MNWKLVLGVVIGVLSAQLWAADKPALKPVGKSPAAKAPADEASEAKKDGEPLEDRVSYALGFDHGRSIREGLGAQNVDLKDAAALRGFRAALSGGKSEMSDKEVEETFRELQEQIASRNAEQGEEFLAANKKKPGVKTTNGGVQYKVIKKGTGKKPTLRDTVKVNYRGKLINGKEFDSSYAREQPLELPVARFIPGWAEALQLMEVGSKWEIYVPAKLAYGDQMMPNIGPNSTLIFEVDLLDIVKPENNLPRIQQGEEAEELQK